MTDIIITVNDQETADIITKRLKKKGYFMKKLDNSQTEWKMVFDKPNE